jgi:hypothetical protein
MIDESTLQKKAREAIQAGTFPHSRPANMWGGPGCGACCTICGELLKRDELEYELEYADDHDGARRRNYHVHIKCFAALESERQNLEAISRAVASGDQPRLTSPPPRLPTPRH